MEKVCDGDYEREQDLHQRDVLYFCIKHIRFCVPLRHLEGIGAGGLLCEGEDDGEVGVVDRKTADEMFKLRKEEVVHARIGPFY